MLFTFQIQDAECEDNLQMVVLKDDVQIILMQAAFTCEFVNMANMAQSMSVQHCAHCIQNKKRRNTTDER